MIFAWLALGPVVDPTTVSNSALAVYGIAAPFALLCLFAAFLFRKERDAARAEAITALAAATAAANAATAARDARIEELHAQIEALHEEAARNAQQLVTGLAPRIYDAALLYRERNRAVAESTPAAVEPV